mmetsp:Transcript_67216/g.129903  ORF Transcript_67216/g.129903 Transcript_67216/m.129903 type:complete len:145 (-) Transcript_67216:31-465(-)
MVDPTTEGASTENPKQCVDNSLHHGHALGVAVQHTVVESDQYDENCREDYPRLPILFAEKRVMVVFRKERPNCNTDAVLERVVHVMTVNGQKRAFDFGRSWNHLVHGGICLVKDAQYHASFRDTSKASVGGAGVGSLSCRARTL